MKSPRSREPRRPLNLFEGRLDSSGSTWLILDPAERYRSYRVRGTGAARLAPRRGRKGRVWVRLGFSAGWGRSRGEVLFALNPGPFPAESELFIHRPDGPIVRIVVRDKIPVPLADGVQDRPPLQFRCDAPSPEIGVCAGKTDPKGIGAIRVFLERSHSYVLIRRGRDVVTVRHEERRFDLKAEEH